MPLADGSDAFVPAVMEHIELAGIHSGDSACVIPPVSIPPKHIETIEEYTQTHRQRAEGCRPDEHPVRHREGQGLHPRGQSPRVPHRAAGLQGLQYPDGPHRHPAHAGQEAGRPASCSHREHPAFRRQGSRCSRSTCSRKSTRCSGPRCGPPAKCWAWRRSFGLAFFKAQEAAGGPLPSEGHGASSRSPTRTSRSSWRPRADSPSWASGSRPPTAR